MGNLFERPVRIGSSPYTRSGEPPPKLNIPKSKDVPYHRLHDPMSLEMHMADERVRTAGLSKAERDWRQKFIKDQHLHPDEPIHVDAVHRQMNPIRVIYRWPWDKLYKHFIRPTFGTYYGNLIRVNVPKLFLVYFSFHVLYYYWKYEKIDWQRRWGLNTRPRAKHSPVYQEGHDERDLLLGLSRPDVYSYFHPDFVHRMQDFDVGQTNRPW